MGADGTDLHISCCARYDCARCDYHTGVIVEEAEGLQEYIQKHGSLKLIAEHTGAYDFDAFITGLNWIASQKVPCRGCRLGGGWSWSPDCLVRNCVMEKGVEFCHQCGEFPCGELQEEPLLDRKRKTIEANERMKEIGIEKWVEAIRKRHEKEPDVGE